MLPLDAETYARVTAAVVRAGKAGQDVAEYLHRHGLLSSPEWQRTVQADAIATLAERMSAHPATLWHTDQVANWLRRQADDTRKG